MLDVIVVSAFGRETWLLKKLKEQGLNFKSFDVTDFFYKTPQSFTVPFGMRLSNEQDEILKCGYIFNKQFQGWSVISDRGVVEANGFLKSFHLEKRGELARKIFANQFSTYDYPFGVLDAEESVLDVAYSTYETLSVSESIKVQATDSVSILLREGGQFVDHNGESFQATYLINFLEPYMCRELEKQNVVCAEFAHVRDIKPLYIWQSFQLSTAVAQHLSHMPKQTVLLSQVERPWIEENFLVINKEAASGEYMVWSKIIFELRNNSKYISDLKSRLEATLARELKLTEAAIRDHFVSLTQGLSPYPVYDRNESLMFKKWYDRGVFYCGFEVCDSFNLDEQIRIQKLVVNGLVEESQRDRQIHA
jgi:hypothetical protein